MEVKKSMTQVAVEERAVRLGMTIAEMDAADRKFVSEIEWCEVKEGPTTGDLQDRGSSFRHVLECLACQAMFLDAPPPEETKVWPEHHREDFEVSGCLNPKLAKHPHTCAKFIHVIGCKFCQTAVDACCPRTI